MRTLRRGAAAALASLLAVAFLPTAGGGAAPLRYEVQPGLVLVATVVVQEIPVLRLRGAGAEARAAEVVRRLGEVVAQRPLEFAVTVQALPGAAELLVNERHLVTADPEQARANQTTPDALAAQWAARLQAALARNTVILTPNLLVLRMGQIATTLVESFLPGAVEIGPYDQRVAAAFVTGDMITVEAREVGSVLVPIVVGGGSAFLQVVVRREAGTIPAEVIVRVTGDFANPAVVRDAVLRRLEQVVGREPGATVAVGIPPYDPPAVETDSLVIPVSVRVGSPYALPVDRVVRVTVLRETVAVVDPVALLVSNRPEVVLADGVLFEEVVAARHPVRLLYHHQNGTPGHNRILTVMLTNRSERPAEILLIGGLAGPSPDPLFVGQAATVRFLQNLAAGRGYILEIPGQSSYAFTAQTLAPLQLVSGILQLQLLAGDELEVRVQVRLPWLLDRTVTLPVNQVAYPHPKGVFQSPTVTIARTVDLGQTTAIVDLGAVAGLRDVTTGEPLIGDYGVVYRITITAVNSWAREAQAEVVATAAGGPARGAFLIDGRLVEMAIFRPLEERVLATIAVPADQAVPISIVTMPTAGSYYPVRIALRSRE